MKKVFKTANSIGYVEVNDGETIHVNDTKDDFEDVEPLMPAGFDQAEKEQEDAIQREKQGGFPEERPVKDDNVGDDNILPMYPSGIKFK